MLKVLRGRGTSFANVEKGPLENTHPVCKGWSALLLTDGPTAQSGAGVCTKMGTAQVAPQGSIRMVAEVYVLFRLNRLERRESDELDLINYYCYYYFICSCNHIYS